MKKTFTIFSLVVACMVFVPKLSHAAAIQNDTSTFQQAYGTNTNLDLNVSATSSDNAILAGKISTSACGAVHDNTTGNDMGALTATSVNAWNVCLYYELNVGNGVHQLNTTGAAMYLDAESFTNVSNVNVTSTSHVSSATSTVINATTTNDGEVFADYTFNVGTPYTAFVMSNNTTDALAFASSSYYAGDYDIGFGFSNTGAPFDLSPQNYGLTSYVGSLAEIANLGVTLVPTSGGGGSSSTIAFIFPVSTSTGLFSNWLLTANGLNASGSYEAQVSWTATLPNGQVTPILTNVTSTAGFNGTWHITIPRIDWGYNFADDVTVNANATLLDSQDPNNPGADLANPITIATTHETFVLLSIPNSSPSSTLSSGGIVINDTQDGSGNITTSTINGFTYANITTSTPLCVAPSNGIFSFFTGGDLAYGLCSTFQLLFIPNGGEIANINSNILSVEQVPPISWFFTLNNDVSSAVNSTSTTNSGIAIPGVQFDIYGDTSTVTLLPADPTTNSFLGAIQPDGNTIINTGWNLILLLCVLLLMLLFYRLVIL